MSDHAMELAPGEFKQLIVGMRAAYARGTNAMAYARDACEGHGNATIATLIAYDLQAGTYKASARNAPVNNQRWTSQLASILHPLLGEAGSMLEVGCGEATTLAGVLATLPVAPAQALGFDLSWSRCAEGRSWLAEQRVVADLFVADLFRIPLADASIDVVYTAHSLEPNGGREEAALRELWRVTRRALVLVEPIYELASEASRARMREHGYVRGLGSTLRRIGAQVTREELLPFSTNTLNPSGVLIAEKARAALSARVEFQCPLTGTPLVDAGDVYISESTGLVYPVVRGVPLLRPDHAVVASKLSGSAPSL